MKSLDSERPAIGLWLSLASAYSAEIISESDLDWLLIDAEHGPNSIPLVLAQLQSTQGRGPDVVVRAPCDDRWVLKQFLDIGVRNLMIPMIDTAEQAEELVKSVRYPTAGHRGVATSTSRASRFGRNKDYLLRASSELCLIAQIESPLGVSNIGAIARTPGIDAVFIGPADLSANLGHLGNPNAPITQAAIKTCILECVSAGTPIGIICATIEMAKSFVSLGASFIAIGSDIGILNDGVDKLVQQARSL